LKIACERDDVRLALVLPEARHWHPTWTRRTISAASKTRLQCAVNSCRSCGRIE
jgi:hypothetical protein